MLDQRDAPCKVTFSDWVKSQCGPCLPGANDVHHIDVMPNARVAKIYRPAVPGKQGQASLHIIRFAGSCLA